MPIQNSKVSSSELMAKRRARRLNKLQNPEDASDNPKIEPDGPVMAGESKETLPPASDNDGDAPAHEKPKAVSKESDKPIQSEAAGDLGQEHASGVEGRHSKEEENPKQSRRSQPKEPKATVRKQQNDAARIKLHMTLPILERGASPTFDEIADLQGEKLAFGLVLGRALELYVDAVLNGVTQDLPVTYPEGSTKIATSRLVPKSAYDAVTKDVNRSGLLSRFAVGALIGRRALAAFVANDKSAD